jgi:hypothetical protein
MLGHTAAPRMPAYAVAFIRSSPYAWDCASSNTVSNLFLMAFSLPNDHFQAMKSRIAGSLRSCRISIGHANKKGKNFILRIATRAK